MSIDPLFFYCLSTQLSSARAFYRSKKKSTRIRHVKLFPIYLLMRSIFSNQLFSRLSISNSPLQYVYSIIRAAKSLLREGMVALKTSGFKMSRLNVIFPQFMNLFV